MSIIQQIRSKLQAIFFLLFYKQSFAMFGKKSFVSSPFRFDGASNIKVGEKTFFQPGVWLYCCSADKNEAELIFGDECVLGYNNHITSVRHVVIEDYVLTANNVYISDNLHEYEDIDVPIIQQPVKFKREVRIGSGSWIGENVCIIGASVGKNCVIGANAVVTKDIPDYSVAVGNPARVIKQYNAQRKEWVVVNN